VNLALLDKYIKRGGAIPQCGIAFPWLKWTAFLPDESISSTEL